MSQTKQARLVIDKEKVLSTIIAYVARETKMNTDFYVNDNHALDVYIQKNQNFPWQILATQLGLDRWRLYHWYFETFQRALNGSVEKDDLMVMKDQIRSAMVKDEDLGRQFQNKLKTILSKEYHRSSFSISFNNMKRQVMKELGVEDKPARLYETRVSVPKQELQFIQIKKQLPQPEIVDQDFDMQKDFLMELTMPEADSEVDFEISYIPSSVDSSICSSYSNSSLPAPPTSMIHFIAFDHVVSQ